MEKGLVELTNGQTEMIFNDKDIVNIIETHLGYDFAKYVDTLVKEADKTKAWVEQKYNSDMDSYESTMESQRTCLTDILEQIQNLQNMFNQPRLKKQECYKILLQIERDINNEI